MVEHPGHSHNPTPSTSPPSYPTPPTKDSGFGKPPSWTTRFASSNSLQCYKRTRAANLQSLPSPVQGHRRYPVTQHRSIHVRTHQPYLLSLPHSSLTSRSAPLFQQSSPRGQPPIHLQTPPSSTPLRQTALPPMRHGRRRTASSITRGLGPCWRSSRPF